MYVLIRVGFFCAVFYVVLRVLRSRAKKAVKWAAVVLLAAILTVFSLFSVENAFVSFDSPETAFRYCHPGSASVLTVVPGRDCDLVLGRGTGDEVVFAAPKSDDGWKMGDGFKLSSRTAIVGDGVFVILYRYRGADDLFVAVIYTGEPAPNLSDRYHSDFSAVCYDRGNVFHVHWVSIPDASEGYTLIVDGEAYAVG